MSALELLKLNNPDVKEIQQINNLPCNINLDSKRKVHVSFLKGENMYRIVACDDELFPGTKDMEKRGASFRTYSPVKAGVAIKVAIDVLELTIKSLEDSSNAQRS